MVIKDIVLGIVCPMANEFNNCEQFVRDVIEECNKYEFQSISLLAIFDKACTDGTFDRLNALSNELPELVVISSPENRCVVDAYLRGYREALDRRCDWILEMDAGYSHQPSDIPPFFDAMIQGYDCVFGSRFCKNAKYINSPRKRYLLSWGGQY